MPDAPDHSACVADHEQVPLNYWNSLLLHLSLIQGMRKKNVKDLLRITEQLKLLTSGLEKHLQLQMHFHVKI